jgi:hypothetical protein
VDLLSWVNYFDFLGADVPIRRSQLIIITGSVVLLASIVSIFVVRSNMTIQFYHPTTSLSQLLTVYMWICFPGLTTLIFWVRMCRFRVKIWTKFMCIRIEKCLILGNLMLSLLFRTVLGPLLFLCHISGLPNAMKSLDDCLLKAHKNNVNGQNLDQIYVYKNRKMLNLRKSNAEFAFFATLDIWMVHF